ncbi:glycosyltransferase [Flavobacterium sp.]|jgi:glycosyltransferase involved in cell wall biosynthesis|uniref:glycosyltransferase family protein n=1 Tax=Flavobacterium sp. TaxID=239 RepID=UPI002A831DD6|nr:glycosyltransferase [Flavobacterium sp.]
MKILLLGEYSRLHNSLKEGLVSLDHEVIIIGCGDKFKQFPVDYSIYAKTCNKTKLGNIIFKGIRKITSIDFEKIEKAIRFYFLIPKLTKFDHVQLINSDALETYTFLSRFLYKRLFAKIKSRSLLVCGDETPVIEYLLKNEMKYSILTPYFANKSHKKQFHFPLKYITSEYRKTFNWLNENCQNIITSDLDYQIPMQKMGFKTTFIPNPINTDKIEYSPLKIDDKIIIFLGINRLSYLKKGIPYFEKALEIIQTKYTEKVEVIITENIPYNEYISIYNKTHILLDQIYAYDQGYNALEAMTKGKVVFTGAETEFLQHYHLSENEVCVNALPDENDIVEKLSLLIENPDLILEISKNAKAFIEKEHHYKTIASTYLKTWGVI